MLYPLIKRRELEVLNNKSLKYPLAVAEKDYFLAIVSKIIYDSSLRDKLVFKGGTAIHHCYLQQSRFSEDLDFSSLDKSITLEEVKTLLHSQDFLEVKKDYVSKATIKIERLKYSGLLGLPNSLKVEIDFIQNVILPAKEVEYKNVWGVKTNVKVMDIKEVGAEKIRAANDRARYRDFYDLVLLFNNFNFDLKEIVELMRQKEIRNPITQEGILRNWGVVKKEKETGLERIYYSKEVSESSVEALIKKLKINLKK